MHLIGTAASFGAAETATGSLYTLTLGLDANSKNGLTTRVVFPIANLTLPISAPTRFRVRIPAGSSEGLTITAAYIGVKAPSGDAYDFAATPTALTWNGSGTVVIPSGTSQWSDWVPLAWDLSNGLVISVYCAGGTGSDMTKTNTSAPVNAYFRSANDPATVDATGYTLQSANASFIEEIQSDGF